jgi:hypothetical protein
MLSTEKNDARLSAEQKIAVQPGRLSQGLRKYHARSGSVATALVPDHDLVAAPFADGYVATPVMAALTPAIGPDTDVNLS